MILCNDKKGMESISPDKKELPPLIGIGKVKQFIAVGCGSCLLGLVQILGVWICNIAGYCNFYFLGPR
jgi:hypothetical protein